MNNASKQYKEKLAMVDRNKQYNIEEAIILLKKVASAKFDETVELSLKLGVNLKRSDQNVRGTVMLPAGTGTSVKVVVITSGEKQTEARDAGADFTGDDDIIQKIIGGWMDFDIVIATPDMMPKVGKLGKILGAKGLMPNPKAGTVSTDVAKTIKEFKMGKIEFKMDKGGVLHIPIGKISFDADKIISNLKACVDAIVKSKPSSVKGVFIKTIYICSTMGPGIKLNPSQLIEVN